jgi:hypothetical protein
MRVDLEDGLAQITQIAQIKNHSEIFPQIAERFFQDLHFAIASGAAATIQLAIRGKYLQFEKPIDSSKESSNQFRTVAEFEIASNEMKAGIEF